MFIFGQNFLFLIKTCPNFAFIRSKLVINWVFQGQNVIFWLFSVKISYFLGKNCQYFGFFSQNWLEIWLQGQNLRIIQLNWLMCIIQQLNWIRINGAFFEYLSRYDCERKAKKDTLFRLNNQSRHCESWIDELPWQRQ